MEKIVLKGQDEEWGKELKVVSKVRLDAALEIGVKVKRGDIHLLNSLTYIDSLIYIFFKLGESRAHFCTNRNDVLEKK